MTGEETRIRSGDTLLDQAIGLRPMIEAAAVRHPTAAAIAGPGRLPLTYDGLCRQLDEVHRTLRGLGVGRSDRVALVLSGGPEAAAACVAVAAAAICAPLSPAHHADEFEYYLSDLRASAVLVESGVQSSIRTALRRRSIPLIELTTAAAGEAGVFTLEAGGQPRSPGGDLPAAEDVALILYTSGTTDRPKKVPLTHGTLWARVRQRVAALGLTDHDRCLNMMPLYHDSGLQTLLATLASGGTVFCPPRFDADAFFTWLEEFRPTWYAAVPTMLLAILSCANDHMDSLARCPLRFIRSTTGALAPQALRELERVFAAPVIDTYGMTEVGTLCSNPLPPRPRKAGSVGVPAGPDVTIVDDAGVRLPPGVVGEVVARGPSVFRGYEDDPAATAAALRDGWFRTGDLGMLDSDGYLFLKGRLKEIINRGGEKILPREVEEVLCAHSAVKEAVVFPLPHPTLGEETAAAVVLHRHARATEPELREFVATRLAAFKVPCRIVSVPEIPRDPAGKVRRRDLAAHFSPVLQTPSNAPETPLEEALARIWAEELGVPRVDLHDNFFELGGDSISAVRVCARVQELVGQALPGDIVFRVPTVMQLAGVLGQAEATRSSAIVAIQPGGARPPLFCVHPASGLLHAYLSLASHLGSDQPVYGLPAQRIDGTQPSHTRIEDMAGQYVQDIRALHPQGPYLLCGYLMGGVVAWEIAQQLHGQGQQVALLALLDTRLYRNAARAPERASVLQFFLRRVECHLDILRGLSPKDRLVYLPRRLKARLNGSAGAGPVSVATAPELAPAGARVSQPATFRTLRQLHKAAADAYLPHPYAGPITLFLSRQYWTGLRGDPRLPGRLATGPVEIHRVSGDHYAFIKEPLVRVLARLLRQSIDTAIEPGR